MIQSLWSHRVVAQLSAIVSLLAFSAGAAFAQVAAVDPATRSALAWQLALERHCFSPGIIDGKTGPKTVLSTREFQRAHGLPVTGQLDAATAAALGGVDKECVTSYTIEPADIAAVAPAPKGWLAKSKLTYLGYDLLIEAVAEKFRCSTALLERLNPGVNISALKAGMAIRVPVIGTLQTASAQRLEVDLSQKVIRAFDASGQLVGLFHCSIAADPAKRPTGEARVTFVAENPWYSFDPAMWPEVKDVHDKLLIPPGPRSPVGVRWIGLSLRGYGIHGTPNPAMIGKTGSHGCFRLTNWDATRLGGMVSAGTPVKFITPPSTPTGAAAPALASAVLSRPGR